MKRLHIAQKIEEDNEEIRRQMRRNLSKVRWKKNVGQHLVRKILRKCWLKKKMKSVEFVSGKWEREKNVGGESRQHFDHKNKRRRWRFKKQTMQNLSMITWKEKNVGKYREDVE